MLSLRLVLILTLILIGWKTFTLSLIGNCSLLFWYCTITLTDWLKNSRHFVIQSEVKPKSIVTRMRSFSRPSRQLHISNFDWFTVLFVSFVLIARSDRFLWLWAFDTK